MDNKTYRELAIKTESPIDQRLRDRILLRRNIRLLHCIMGIGSELEEIKLAIQNGDMINIGEEIADNMWFLSLGADELNFELPEPSSVFISNTTVSVELEMITNTVSKLLDIIKKIIFYGREYPVEDIKIALQNIYVCILHLCTLFNLNIDELKKKNIDKLAARYGDKFSEYLAINRNLDKEYRVLNA